MTAGSEIVASKETDNRNILNVGIIGLGKMGILHAGITNSLPGVCVKAICEKPGLLLRFAKALLPKAITVYQDHLKMIDNETLDAVFITTPIITHVPLAVDIARRNGDISLFVEKPLGASYDQARIACEIAKRLRGIHMVGFQKRYSPMFRQAKRLINERCIGDLMFFRAYSFSSDVLGHGASWRLKKGTGGVMLDLASHLLDLLLWFFGEPKSVLAASRRLHSTEVEDYVHSILSFDSGLVGHMDACWSIRSFRLPEICIEVYGKGGFMVMTDDFVKVRVDRESIQSKGVQGYYKQSFNTSVPFLLADPEYTSEVESFLCAVRERILPDCNFFQAAKVNAIIDEIAESTRLS